MEQQSPPAMRTYLKRNDLSEKRIAFFCTNEGSGADDAFSCLRALARNQDPVAQLVVGEALKDR